MAAHETNAWKNVHRIFQAHTTCRNTEIMQSDK